MRYIVVLIFCFMVADIFGQNVANPTVYLNSDTIDWKDLHILPSSMESLRVEHKTARGEIYINVKHSVTFLTLDMILKKHAGIDDSIGQVIYIIDGNVVADKYKVKVDGSYFIEVEIKRFDKVHYIDERHRNLILANVRLLTEKPKPVVRIRGDEGFQIRN